MHCQSLLVAFLCLLLVLRCAVNFMCVIDRAFSTVCYDCLFAHLAPRVSVVANCWHLSLLLFGGCNFLSFLGARFRVGHLFASFRCAVEPSLFLLTDLVVGIPWCARPELCLIVTTADPVVAF